MIEVTLCIDGLVGLATRDAQIKTNVLAPPRAGELVSIPNHLLSPMTKVVAWWRVTEIVHGAGAHPSISVGIRPETAG